MDRFGALSAFVAVVEHGGFAPAGRRLGMAPSSLTRQVDNLEASLGTQLVNRSTRKISLTEAGARYFEDARRILEDLENADRSVVETQGLVAGTLRVTMPVAFGRLHVAPFIPRFLREHPGMRLDVQLTDGMSDLVEDRLDLAIRLGVLMPSQIIARHMGPHRRVICASPDYLGERGTPTTPADLAEHNCLVFDYQTGDSIWTLVRGQDIVRVPVSGNLRASGSELLREAAIGGAGLLLMPTWLVGHDIAAGRLIPLLDNWEPMTTNGESAIWALYPPSRRGSPKIRCFLDFLQARFGSPPYWDRQAPPAT